jgi:hypothetical protein
VVKTLFSKVGRLTDLTTVHETIDPDDPQRGPVVPAEVVSALLASASIFGQPAPPLIE